MRHRHRLGIYPTVKVLVTAGLVVGAGACGSGPAGSPAGGAPGERSGPRTAPVALATGVRKPGEIVVSGQSTPKAYGPFTLRGRYRVRFEQVDPADRRRTFTDQTSFVAYAAPAPDQETGPGTRLLIRGGARTGSATVTLNGRLWVNVSFGDFPYALRLSPVGR